MGPDGRPHAVARHRQGRQRPEPPVERGQAPAVGHVPRPSGPIPAARQEAAVREEGQAGDLLGVPLRQRSYLVGRQREEADGGADGEGQGRAVGAEGQISGQAVQGAGWPDGRRLAGADQCQRGS